MRGERRGRTWGARGVSAVLTEQRDAFEIRVAAHPMGDLHVAEALQHGVAQHQIHTRLPSRTHKPHTYKERTNEYLRENENSKFKRREEARQSVYMCAAG